MSDRILLVEDNALNRELLRDWLEAEGFDVRAASNLPEAFAAARAEAPDAVLLDIQVGAEDGLEFAAWMRRQALLERVPVVAVTARAMPGDQERILEAGCNACVAKPIDFAVLRRSLRELLDAAKR